MKMELFLRKIKKKFKKICKELKICLTLHQQNKKTSKFKTTMEKTTYNVTISQNGKTYNFKYRTNNKITADSAQRCYEYKNLDPEKGEICVQIDLNGNEVITVFFDE